MKNKILLIEDDPSEFETIKGWIEADKDVKLSVIPEDFESMALAMDSFEQGNIEDYAIQQIIDSFSEIGLVLCDIELLGDDTGGNKVVKAIRNCKEFDPDFRNKLPIIAITHYANLQKQILDDKANYTIGKDVFSTQPDVQIATIKNQIELFEQNYKEKDKVFIVHGHDEDTRNIIELFIRKLDLEPIISVQQASKGATIIEKLLREARDIKYAIVLYTGCDEAKDDLEDVFSKRRARQNVVFEHGLFCGLLGLNNVVALVKEDVEIPSELIGVVPFIQLDQGENWRKRLAKEMKAVGLPIDINKLY